MTEMQICVLSDSELKAFDPSQSLDEYVWDSFIPQTPVNKLIRALNKDGDYEIYFNLFVRGTV